MSGFLSGFSGALSGANLGSQLGTGLVGGAIGGLAGLIGGIGERKARKKAREEAEKQLIRMRTIAGDMGQLSLQGLSEAGRAERAGIDQSLADRGLYNSTVRDTLQNASVESEGRQKRAAIVDALSPLLGVEGSVQHTAGDSGGTGMIAGLSQALAGAALAGGRQPPAAETGVMPLQQIASRKLADEMATSQGALQSALASSSIPMLGAGAGAVAGGAARAVRRARRPARPMSQPMY